MPFKLPSLSLTSHEPSLDSFPPSTPLLVTFHSLLDDAHPPAICTFHRLRPTHLCVTAATLVLSQLIHPPSPTPQALIEASPHCSDCKRSSSCPPWPPQPSSSSPSSSSSSAPFPPSRVVPTPFPPCMPTPPSPLPCLAWTGPLPLVSKTVLQWERQLRTCDAAADFDIDPTGGTSRVLWAIGDSDPTADSAVKRHSARGVKNLNLLDSQPTSPTPSDAVTTSIMSRPFPIDKDTLTAPSTYYHCQAFQRNFTERSHVIRFTPQVDFYHSALVHHMILYQCAHTWTEEDLAWAGDCYAAGHPAGVDECDMQHVLAGWAVGGGEFSYPVEVSFLFTLHTHPPSRFSFTLHTHPASRHPTSARQPPSSLRYSTAVVPPAAVVRSAILSAPELFRSCCRSTTITPTA